MRFQATLLVLAPLLQQSCGRKNLRKAKAQKPQKRQAMEMLDLTEIQTIEQDDKNNRDLQARIIGGDQSEIGEFPYYVYMGGCGGSLIAPGVVLSAAHCGSFDGDHVFVGGYEVDKTTGGAQRVKVVDGVFHPEYNENTFRNDFALHRLKDPVAMDSDIKFSINSLNGQPAPGQDLTVLGLGATQQGGSLEQYLQDVTVQAMSVDECNRNGYGGDVEGDVMFCAGVNGGGKDSCQGDSGGPLVIRNGNEHIQVGVVSWGYGCARPNFPGVYARVSSAKDWIRSVVCDDWDMSAEFCDEGFQPTASPTEPPTDPPLSCPGDEIAFEFTIRTDEWAEETSWNLKDSENNLVLSGGDYTDDESYDTIGCIPNSCYTLSILDTYGDGLSEGGSNPGYTLILDSIVQEEAGRVNFGFEKTLTFGNCVGSTPPPTPVASTPPTVSTQPTTSQSTPPPTPGSTPQPTGQVISTPQPTPTPPPSDSPTSGSTPPPTPGSTPPPTPGSTPPPTGQVISTPQPTPTPPPSDSPTDDSQSACAADEIEFDWTVTTDEWGSETSWILRNSQSDEIVRGEDYENDTEYNSKQCIPKTCYTVTIFDSYGDGLSVGGINPGYRLVVDGTVIAEAGGVNFGYQRAIQFGDCSTDEAECIPFKLKLETDDWGSESSFTLSKDGVAVLDESGFENNKEYIFSDCFEPSQCNKLEMRDSYGDGIGNGRGIEVELDGDVKYKDGDFGYGVGFQYGDC